METCGAYEQDRLADRVGEILSGAKWTHKIHEKQADIYEFLGKSLSLVTLVATAVSGSGAIAAIILDAHALKCLVAVMSAVSLFCSLWNKTFCFEERAARQRVAAKTFLSIRERSKNLSLRIAMGRLGVDEALMSIDELAECYLEVCSSAPSTTGLAVRRARKDLLSGGEAL